MDKETADKTRGMIRRVVLKNIKDDGQTQTASIEVADGVWRDDVEIMQPYGTASHPPADGALAIALAVGADQGDLVVMPASNPSKRMGKLPEGAVGLYNEFGDKVLILPDGKVQISGATSLEATFGGVIFRISAEGVDITGGHVRHNGKNIGDTHIHGGVIHGDDTTTEPAN